MSLMDDELTAGGFSYKEVFRPQEKLLMGLGWVGKTVAQATLQRTFCLSVQPVVVTMNIVVDLGG